MPLNWHGYKRGCLPRASRFATRCPAFSDHIKPIPERDWPEAIREAKSLRPWVPCIFDQNGYGSCATESAGGGMQIVRAAAGRAPIELNPLSVYCFTKVGRDGGSAIDTNLAQLRDVGILPEDIWPRSKGIHQKPPQDLLDEHAIRIEEFYDLGSIADGVTAYYEGWPFVYARRGHSMLGVTIWQDLMFEALNSWGKKSGDGGYVRESLYSDIDFRYGLFAVRTVTGHPDDLVPPPLEV
jgi:hypothetical protein